MNPFIDDDEIVPLEEMLKPDMIKAGTNHVAEISDEKVRARAYEFLRIWFDPENQGSVVRLSTIFLDPHDFGLALGQAISNAVDIYALERSGVGKLPDGAIPSGLLVKDDVRFATLCEILAGVHATCDSEIDIGDVLVGVKEELRGRGLLPRSRRRA